MAGVSWSLMDDARPTTAHVFVSTIKAYGRAAIESEILSVPKTTVLQIFYLRSGLHDD
jgi:hypothetical protein